MPVTTTTSHAAPFIRYQLIHAIGSAQDARTQREQTALRREAFAYGKALEIIKDAQSCNEPVGVADLQSIPSRYVQAAKDFLADDWYRFGFEERPPVVPS